MNTLQPTLKPFKWNPIHKPTKILKPKTHINPIISQSSSSSSSSAGKIKRTVLTKQGRTKLNISPDRDFYAYPRLVTHVDNNFINTLTNLYRNKLSPHFEILDLMSSWVSHLPKEVNYKRVVGHGLNAQELAKNPRLDYYIVKDINKDQSFEFDDASFDAVLCTVSVQYMQEPEKVFAEVFRLLRPGGVVIVSFSNRMFYEKAVEAWREGSGYGRVQLVVQYFQCVDGFTEPEVVREIGDGSERDGSVFGWVKGVLGLLSGSDPFTAVIAYKNFKPVYD